MEIPCVGPCGARGCHLNGSCNEWNDVTFILWLKSADYFANQVYHFAERRPVKDLGHGTWNIVANHEICNSVILRSNLGITLQTGPWWFFYHYHHYYYITSLLNQLMLFPLVSFTWFDCHLWTNQRAGWDCLLLKVFLHRQTGWDYAITGASAGVLGHPSVC